MSDCLLDSEMQARLESSGALNFLDHDGCDSKVSKLYCLRTDGDGNCLLHAISLAVWGVHDRGLSVLALHLRRILQAFLASALRSLCDL